MSTIQELSAKQIALRPDEHHKIATIIVDLLRSGRSQGDQQVGSNQLIAHQILTAINQVLAERTGTAPDGTRTKKELVEAITNFSLVRAADPRQGPAIGQQRDEEGRLFNLGVKMVSEPTEIRRLVEIALQNPSWLGLPSSVCLTVSYSTLIRTVERMFADGQLPAGAERTWHEILPDLRRSQLGG